MKTILRLLPIIIALVACTPLPAPELVPETTCQNSWNGLHLETGDRTIVVADETATGVDWRSWNVPGLPVTFTDTGPGFRLVFTDSDSTEFYGLASISRIGRHVQVGQVLMSSMLADLKPAAWSHVACQEVFHVVGADHQRHSEYGAAAGTSCMNDCQGLGGGRAFIGCLENPAGTALNAHDLATLRSVYAHNDRGDPPPFECDSTFEVHRLASGL